MQSYRPGLRRTARGYFGGGASYLGSESFSARIFERGSTFIECNVSNNSTSCQKKQAWIRLEPVPFYLAQKRKNARGESVPAAAGIMARMP
jgi:hypothetical protein